MKTKKILLTGASRGIGKAIYDELLKIGMYEILAPGRDELDLRSKESVSNYINTHCDVDILINVAGINVLSDIENISDDAIESMISVNLKSPLRLIRGVAGGMKQRNFGRIVNFSSIWGVRSKEFRTLYSMAKFGINGLTHSLARELGPYNILINSVCPGYVNTEMTKQNVPPEEQKKIKKTIPLGRFAEPEEIANFVNFLISEKNTYITGQTLIIDGGFLA